MSKLSSRRAVILLLAAGLAFRLAFVTHDLSDLVLRGPLYDDSFYSFGVARNIARGLGSTFDGVEPTNGYQPLYVLLLVPIYWLSGDDPAVPIYAALVVSAVLNVLTGLVLYRLVRPHVAPAAALFTLVLWGFGPAVVRQAVNGLETALAMFLLAATLEYYVRVYRPHPDPGPRQRVTLGLLLGLSVFARIDAALFAIALAADVLRRGGRRVLRPLAAVAVTAAAVVAPWCVGSQLLLGTPLPRSGEATRFLSEAYAPHDHPEFSQASFAAGPPAAFLADNLRRSLLQFGTSPLLQPGTRGVERLLGRVRVTPATSLQALAALLLVVTLVLVRIARRPPVGVAWLAEEYGFLFLYAGLLVVAYSFVVFGQIFYSRYYYPVFFLSVLLGACALDVLLRVLPAGRPRRAAAAAVLGVYGVCLPYMCAHRIQNGNYRFLHVVDWIAAHTPPGATIGVFNSGAIGYFSDRRIVNLDGKVNPMALAALRRDRLGDYVQARSIDYVVDHAWILDRFLLAPGSGAGLRFARADDEAGGAGVGVPGWSAYRVERSGPEPVQASGAIVSRRSL